MPVDCLLLRKRRIFHGGVGSDWPNTSPHVKVDRTNPGYVIVITLHILAEVLTHFSGL